MKEIIFCQIDYDEWKKERFLSIRLNSQTNYGEALYEMNTT